MFQHHFPFVLVYGRPAVVSQPSPFGQHVAMVRSRSRLLSSFSRGSSSASGGGSGPVIDYLGPPFMSDDSSTGAVQYNTYTFSLGVGVLAYGCRCLPQFPTHLEASTYVLVSWGQ